MDNIELIPMGYAYRKHLKSLYFNPLFFRLGIYCLLLIIVSLLIMGEILDTDEHYIALFVTSTYKATLNKTAFSSLIIFSFLCLSYIVIQAISKIGRHYYNDYRFGYVVKERTYISKVVDTPAGVNIYWLRSETIFTFVPEPYMLFTEGTPVNIYYLKYSKQLLRYEIPD